MELLFDDRYYKINASFGTALRYRTQYGGSVYDIMKEPNKSEYKKKVVTLLHTAIEGEGISLSELLDASDKNVYLVLFADKVYAEMMKVDRLYEKYAGRMKKNGESDSAEEEFDELLILSAYSKASLPESALDKLTTSQAVGLMLQSGEMANGSVQYNKMSKADMTAFYGRRKTGGHDGG